METGSAPFAVDCPWRLFTPPGPAPAGGWPLVLALHGWGMSAASFARRCRPLLFEGAAILFPQGPFAFELRHDGKIRIGHAWYLFDGHDEPFRSTLGQAEAHLLGLVDGVAPGAPIDRSRFFVVGFSQGAYAGFFLALRNRGRCAGMVALGGGRLREDFIAADLAGEPKIPFLLVHGTADASVPIERTILMKEVLERHGFPVELTTLDVGHEVTASMLAVARRWLVERAGAR